MTTQQAQALKYGDKVYYHSTPAVVQAVRKNGVFVSHETRKGYITERVAAVYLKHRA